MHLLKTLASLFVLTQLAGCTIVSESPDNGESPDDEQENQQKDAGELPEKKEPSTADSGADSGGKPGEHESDAGAGDDPGDGGDAGDDPSDAGGHANSAADCEPTAEIPSAIKEDTTIGPGCFSMGMTRVASGARLTIAPGTTVLVGSGGMLSNGSTATNTGNGTIVAEGTAEKPIVFQPEDPEAEAGAWRCIHINSAGAGSRFEWVTIDRAGVDCDNAGTPAALVLESGIAVAHVLVKNSKNYGIQFGAEPPVRFENNTFEGNAKSSLRVRSASVPSLGSGHEFLTAGDSIEVRGNITTGTWSDHGVPYFAPAGMDMASSAALILEAGVEIRMGNGSFGDTGGTIRAIGTADAPIRFRSAQAAPAAGDWGCLELGVSSRLEHVIIEHAGNGAGCSGGGVRTAIYTNGLASILSTQIRDIAGMAIRSRLSCSDTATAAQWCSETTLENVATTPAITCNGGEDLCAE